MTNNKCIICGLSLICTRCDENDSEEMNGTYDKLEEFLHEPNCCDCEFTYDGGDCDNCTKEGLLLNDKEVMNGTYDELDLELKAKMLVEFRNITKELEKIRKILNKK